MFLIISINKESNRHFWSICNNENILSLIDKSKSVVADISWLDILEKYSGYVNITLENGEISNIECDEAGYSEYIKCTEKELIEPAKTAYDEMAEAYMEGVNSI